MVALQNVQHLLVRANSMPKPSYVHISQVEMETAGRPADRGTASGRSALGVEFCDCPSGYNGSSCQNAAIGYFRKHAADALDHIDHLKLLGDSVLCDCHNHSTACDGESGRCLDCQHHTDGKTPFNRQSKGVSFCGNLLFIYWDFLARRSVSALSKRLLRGRTEGFSRRLSALCLSYRRPQLQRHLHHHSTQ
jgi:Laminin B (Domain IV)/Laminin EGF domain